MDTTLSDPLVGQVLDGRYRVESRLARGGMATVYRARDMRLDRTVALKVMHPVLAEDEEFVHRFIGEAKSAARLSHPDIVAVYDQGEDGDIVFLTMEYLPGRTLRDLLRERGRLETGEALRLMEPVLAALGAAHRAGLVHRDVKPENVLLADDGRVKVGDFGLARAIAASNHTKTSGLIIGTVAYLSPEQVTHGHADARSDVYSAGVLLFELVTGCQPFEGDTPLAVAYRHVNEDVPRPSSLVPGIPPTLDALVAAATARDPALRPADATSLLADVSRVRAGLPPASALPPGFDGELDGTFDAPYDDRDGGAPGDGPSGGADGPSDGADSDPDGDPEGGTFDDRAPDDGAGPRGAADAGRHTELMPRRAGETLIVGHDDLLPWSRRGTGPQPPTPPPDPPGSGRPPGGSPPRHPAGAGSGPAPPKAGRRRVWAALSAALVLAIVLGGASYWYGWYRWTKTPSLTNMPVAAAERAAERRGFEVRWGTPAFSEVVPRGSVISTEPRAGERILRHGTITLVPSKGPERIAVPDVRGESLDDARRAIRQARLFPGAVRRAFSVTVPKGDVVSTRPKIGSKVKPGSRVNLVVSSGVEIPDIRGWLLDRARKLLEDHGFDITVRETYDEAHPKGTVLVQDPHEGGADKGTAIHLTVSKGPRPVPIPDVAGKPRDTAKKILEHAGFKVKIHQLNGPGPKRVLSQTPTGKAPKGTVIDLYVY